MLEISSDTNDLARTERFARSAGELLETKLQGELDEPRIPGCLHLSKLICAQFDRYWLHPPGLLAIVLALGPA
jgi:hypothetical protein